MHGIDAFSLDDLCLVQADQQRSASHPPGPGEAITPRCGLTESEPSLRLIPGGSEWPREGTRVVTRLTNAQGKGPSSRSQHASTPSCSHWSDRVTERLVGSVDLAPETLSLAAFQHP